MSKTEANRIAALLRQLADRLEESPGEVEAFLGKSISSKPGRKRPAEKEVSFSPVSYFLEHDRSGEELKRKLEAFTVPELRYLASIQNVENLPKRPKKAELIEKIATSVAANAPPPARPVESSAPPASTSPPSSASAARDVFLDL